MMYRLSEEEKRMRKEEIELMMQLISTKPQLVNDVDKLRFAAPKGEGLYLVGNTVFNPFTQEEFYLVKVGTSSNLKSRMSGYRTQNPLLFHIDYYEKKDLRERKCHEILCRSCKETLERSEEWFRVEREIYLEICEKGFQYFLERI